MRKLILFVLISCLVILVSSAGQKGLREIYSGPSDNWPAPWVPGGLPWKELGLLPAGPLSDPNDSMKQQIELGKTLFFDPRLSQSGKISCASCHQPELNWTDGKEKSVGHEGAMNKRNAPSIANSWFYQKLFWDGRARNLADQAFAPIVSESEMASEMPDLMIKLRAIPGYRVLFKKAFGDEKISPERMTDAIAVFEKSVISRKSRFDEFLEGNRKALSQAEIRGLHLFRTRARCMNCHYGPLFTDNDFHNLGFSGADAGYFKVTHRDADSGKFKTPSLRDVMRTGPWMHDGQLKDMKMLINALDKANGPPGPRDLFRPLGLSKKDRDDLRAFLEAISAPPAVFNKPVMPE